MTPEEWTNELRQFGANVYVLRTRKGMKQTDLARAVFGDITLPRGQIAARNRDRITAYELGRGFPDKETLAKLAKALGVTVYELVGGEPL